MGSVERRKRTKVVRKRKVVRKKRSKQTSFAADDNASPLPPPITGTGTTSTTTRGSAGGGGEDGGEALERRLKSTLGGCVAGAASVTRDRAFAETLSSLGAQYKSSAARKAHLAVDDEVETSKYYASQYKVPEKAMKKYLSETAQAYEDNLTFSPSLSTTSIALAIARRESPDKPRIRTRDPENPALLDCSHVPAIDPNSSRIAEERDRESGTPYTGALRTELMYQLGQEWDDRRQALRRGARRKEDKECTFNPAISPTARVVAQKDPRNFLQRALAWQASRDELLDELRSEKEHQSESHQATHCTFRPKINHNVPASTSQNPGRRPAGFTTFVSRYEKAARQREEAKAILSAAALRSHPSSSRIQSSRPPSRDTVRSRLKADRARSQRNRLANSHSSIEARATRAAAARKISSLARPVGYEALAPTSSSGRRIHAVEVDECEGDYDYDDDDDE